MSFTTEHKKKFEDLRFYLNSNNWSQISQKSNGGKSILFSYPPQEEGLYLREAVNQLADVAAFVEVNHLFTRYIDEIGWEDFKAYYQDFSSTPDVVFKSDAEDQDLFDMIINALQSINDKGRIPVLLRTGCLFGTGIENVMIMDHPAVLKFKTPLVIFYPSTIDNNHNLKFLGIKPASKYRCVLID